MEILLDCDGVLADFLTPTLDKLNKATGRNITRADYVAHNTWDIEKVYDIPTAEFWNIIEPDDNHWCNLTPFPWAQKLYDFCCKLGRVTICTTPTLNPDHKYHSTCAAQKTQWLRDHLGISNDAVMIGGRKELMAKPGNVLIDDSPRNVELFNSAGGRGILVPSNWNTIPLDDQMVIEAVKNQLPGGSVVTETVLQEADRIVSGERRNSYGHPLDDFIRTGRLWAPVLEGTWLTQIIDKLMLIRPAIDHSLLYDIAKLNIPVPPDAIALCMAQVKTSREVNHEKRDNRVDAPGYWKTLDMVITERHRREILD